MLQDKESELFAITDKENCFPHFHIDKEIYFCSAYCYSWRVSINILMCFLLHSPTEYPN